MTAYPTVATGVVTATRSDVVDASCSDDVGASPQHPDSTTVPFTGRDLPPTLTTPPPGSTDTDTAPTANAGLSVIATGTLRNTTTSVALVDQYALAMYATMAGGCVATTLAIAADELTSTLTTS